MAGAAQCNKLSEVQYLHSNGCRSPKRLLEVAARGRSLQLLRWCYEHDCRFAEACKAPTAVALRSWRGEAHAWATAEVDAAQQGTYCTDIYSTYAQPIRHHVVISTASHQQHCVMLASMVSSNGCMHSRCVNIWRMSAYMCF
jgi:hypothetical protein